MTEPTTVSAGGHGAAGTLAPESLPGWMGRAEIDTSAPFESVREAVTRFGGSAPWRPPPLPSSGLEESHCFGEVDIAAVKEQTAKLEKDLIVKERETLDVLKELEKTKRLVEGLKMKIKNETMEACMISEKAPDCKEYPIAEKESKSSAVPENCMNLVEKPSCGERQERVTLDVLKELEKTKRLVEGMKMKIKSETMKACMISEKRPDCKEYPIAEKESKSSAVPENHMNLVEKPSPGLILMELKQAKINLTRTTSDLASVRASVESLSNQLENERASLEETRERLCSNSARISSLEKELHQTRLMLHLTKNAENSGSAYPPDISQELHKLSSEAEQYKRMTEAGESEVLRMRTEIEQTKASIKTAEIRWLAARKMEEAAKAAEAVAIAEIKALNSSKTSPTIVENMSGVTLSVEEYETLTKKAQEAEELSMEHIKSAMAQVEEANCSKVELLQNLEEAAAELRTSRKALAEVLSRVEAADQGKLAVEEALQRWRAEHGQRRRSIHNTTKFKNPGPVHHRRESRMLDVNGYSLITDGSKSVLMPTLSIGQILSRKLNSSAEFAAATQESIHAKPKVSLGQMLNRRHGALSPQRSEDRAARKQFSTKRKKFGFAGFSTLLAKQQNTKSKKKKQAWSPK